MARGPDRRNRYLTTFEHLACATLLIPQHARPFTAIVLDHSLHSHVSTEGGICRSRYFHGRPSRQRSSAEGQMRSWSYLSYLTVRGASLNLHGDPSSIIKTRPTGRRRYRTIHQKPFDLRETPYSSALKSSCTFPCRRLGQPHTPMNRQDEVQ